MEEIEKEAVENNLPEDFPEDQIPEPQQDPFELIAQEFKKVYGEINNIKGYCKTLAEKAKRQDSNFKLLLEEKE